MFGIGIDANQMRHTAAYHNVSKKKRNFIEFLQTGNTLAGIWGAAEGLILPAGAQSPVCGFKRVPDHNRPTKCKEIDPEPICEQTRCIEHARKTTAGDRK